MWLKSKLNRFWVALGIGAIAVAVGLGAIWTIDAGVATKLGSTAGVILVIALGFLVSSFEYK